MLTEAIAGSLPMSVGVALSPIPVAAVLVILMTARARHNAPAFLLGWMTGILAIGFAVFLAPGLLTARGDPTLLSGLIRIALGITLLGLGVRQWRLRPAPGAPLKIPGILARLDHIGVIQSAMTGFMLSAVHPKNLILNAAGAAALDTLMPDSGKQTLALLIFMLIASVGIILPVAAYFVAGHRAGAVLGHARDWLIRNNVHVLVVLLLVLGAVLIGRGLHILHAWYG